MSSSADRVPGPVIARLAGASMTFPDGTPALADISLEVREGELISLVGPSGCGKSTLLKLLAGFERPSGGTVASTGGALGYVFQDATLLPWRTVLGNVRLPAELAGTPKAEAEATAIAALRRVGLAGFEGHRPAQLSGGMRMRTSIARALTLRPRLFLFDEPFGALDEITRERLNEELSSLFVLDPFAGVFVTHSVPEAVYLSTRVVVLSERPGRIVADVPVPFAYPRVPELRYTPEFAALAGEVSSALRQAGAAVAA
jgi:NitT/TauT family transport system ATP-binding protein